VTISLRLLLASLAGSYILLVFINPPPLRSLTWAQILLASATMAIRFASFHASLLTCGSMTTFSNKSFISASCGSSTINGKRIKLISVQHAMKPFKSIFLHRAKRGAFF